MVTSYRKIFKSSAVIGGASLINLLINMVKVKFAAILLGSSGVGLLSALTNLSGMIGDFSMLGTNSSGIRQIAEAVGKNDERQIAQTVTVYRRVVWFSGIWGILLMILLAKPLGILTFQSDQYFWMLIALSVSVLFTALSSGQMCLLQGARHIAALSKIKVFGALGGALVAICSFALWGQNGIVVALVAGSAVMLLFSRHYASLVKIRETKVPASIWRHEIKMLLELGMCFMVSGLVTNGVAYCQKILLIRSWGLSGCGIYQAGYALSGYLAGFVLTAMGTDYFPKLTTLIHQPQQLHAAVNEQQEISLLLAFPCVLGIMVFAPLVIWLFYSHDFFAAIPLLRVFAFGVMGRVFIWPLAFLIMAHGDGKLLVVSELFSGAMQLVLFYIGLKHWGLLGGALSFAVSYLCYGGWILALSWFCYSIRVRRYNFVLYGIMMGFQGVTFGIPYWCSVSLWQWVCGIAMVGVGCGTCLFILCHRLGIRSWGDMKSGIIKRKTGEECCH